jgi:hypothetical protein
MNEKPPTGPENTESQNNSDKQKPARQTQPDDGLVPPKPKDETGTDNSAVTPERDGVVNLSDAAHARRHEHKAKRMASMQKAFENFLPINKETRQSKRLKARKKKKGKKKK